MGRLPDFGEQGAPRVTVDPTVGADPSSPSQSAAPQQDASSTGGAPAAPAGSPAEEGQGAVPGSPPAQPPTTPPPPAPTDGQQLQAPPPAPPAEAEVQPGGEEDLTEEEYQRFRQQLQDELAAPYEEKLRTLQSGQDKARAAVEAKLEDANARLDQMMQDMREGKLQGLSPDEQTALRKTWALDDREKKLNEYEANVKNFHSDTDVLALLNEYGPFGVTEEALAAVPVDERELFCEQKRAEYWEQQAKAKQAPPQQPPASQPQQPVPAGATAPSDTGGGGAVEPPQQPNPNQGPDAMADNIGRGDTWERAAFPVRRG